MPTPTQTETTAALLSRIAARDAAALALLYDRHSGMLLAICLRVLRDRADAEEVLADVFLEIWRRADRFDATRGHPLSYLTLLARSRAIDRLRQRGARQRAMVGVEAPDRLAVVVRSLAKAQDLAVVTGDFFVAAPGTPGEELGTSVAGIGDLDADGFDDFAYANAFGEITVVAGGSQPLVADGANPPTLRQLDAFVNVTPNVPVEALAAKDFNGDTFIDLVQLDRATGSAGTVRVTSFADSTASFSGINNTISKASGGRQTLFFKAPGVDAGDVAVPLAATTSVTTPSLGIPISNGFIPLAAGDPLLQPSLQPGLIFEVTPVALQPNVEGTATAVSRVEFQPNEVPLAFVGTDVFFSYVVVESTTPTTTPLKDAGGVVSLSLVD